MIHILEPMMRGQSSTTMLQSPPHSAHHRATSSLQDLTMLELFDHCDGETRPRGESIVLKLQQANFMAHMLVEPSMHGNHSIAIIPQKHYAAYEATACLKSHEDQRSHVSSRTRRRKIPKEVQTGESTTPHDQANHLVVGRKGKRRGSLRSVSHQACVETQKFFQAKNKNKNMWMSPGDQANLARRKAKRRGSLVSVSHQACLETQNFFDAKSKNILFEVSDMEKPTIAGNTMPGYEDLMSLVELAGLLSMQLTDALAGSRTPFIE
jgi:hypothetical protein